MSEYVITCCSTVDMSEEWFRRRDLRPLYFHLYLGDDEYLDDYERSITHREVYDRMLKGEMSRTSQVNVSEYEALWRQLLQEGKDILHITLSSGISGTFNSANIAAEDLLEEFPDRKLYVVDSLTAASGYGLLVDKACDLRDAGMSLEENRDWLEEHKKEVQSWFFTSDLTFFIRGGRVSKTAGLIGQVLNICPLLEVDGKGCLTPREKVRTKKKVIERIVQKMEELAQNGTDYTDKVFLNHSDCEEDGRKVAALIEERFPKLKGHVEIYPIGSTIGCHTGPGTVALFYWGKPKE